MDSYMSYEEYLEQVKTGISTESGECPVTTRLLMLQGKWKSQVLYALGMHDSVRFGVLKKEIPEITNTMLAATLRDLEADGLIHRKQFTGRQGSQTLLTILDRPTDYLCRSGAPV